MWSLSSILRWIVAVPVAMSTFLAGYLLFGLILESCGIPDSLGTCVGADVVGTIAATLAGTLTAPAAGRKLAARLFAGLAVVVPSIVIATGLASHAIELRDLLEIGGVLVGGAVALRACTMIGVAARSEAAASA